MMKVEFFNGMCSVYTVRWKTFINFSAAFTRERIVNIVHYLANIAQKLVEWWHDSQCRNPHFTVRISVSIQPRHVLLMIMNWKVVVPGASFRGLEGSTDPPPRIYDCSLFPVNRTVETVLLLQKQYVMQT